jgi:hypothetical protein
VNNTGCNGWGGHAAEQNTTHGMTKHRKCTEDGRCVCIDDAELVSMQRGKSAHGSADARVAAKCRAACLSMWQCGAGREHVERKESGYAAKFLTCWNGATAKVATTCTRTRRRQLWCEHNNYAREMVKEMQHDTIMRIDVKRKCDTRRLFEARRGSVTVQGLVECKT